MQLSFSKEELTKQPAIVVGVLEDRVLTKQAKQVDKALGGYLAKALSHSRMSGKKGQVLTVVPPSGWDRIVLVGLGKKDTFKERDATELGGKIAEQMNADRVQQAAIALDDAMMQEHSWIAEMAAGMRLRSYRFDKYRTTLKDDDKPTFTKATIMCKEPDVVKKAYAKLDKVVDGVYLTRDLVNEPANILNPDSFPDYCKELESLGVQVDVLGEAKMKKLGMDSLLAVGRGSAYESKLIVMRYNGGKKNDQPLAFVGKGVTFDTGGISLKPSNGMEEMKWDMGGAGVVTGLMKALAGRKAKVNVIGVIGVVENMPAHNAQRPGDVVTSMSGQTIEVLNTDAEGRLVLADALWYTQEKYKPQFMIDLATLTGAMIVCLGHERAGIFSNDDTLSERLFQAGEETGERVWRLPLGDEYDEQINCDIADMKNIGSGRGAGSITAAQFLQRFVNDLPWVHIDIAGVTWGKKDIPTAPKGGTAFGVRLLDRFVEDYYE
jgi:leucyl aminopeptidase